MGRIPGTRGVRNAVLSSRRALSIHEKSLFTVRHAGERHQIEHAHVYPLLTDRPDNRPPKSLRRSIDYDLDHLLPVSVYAIAELWKLAPADRRFNQGVLADALRQDVAARFTRAGSAPGARAITTVVVDLSMPRPEARNLPRFKEPGEIAAST
jgi:hypothetical protein